MGLDAEEGTTTMLATLWKAGFFVALASASAVLAWRVTADVSPSSLSILFALVVVVLQQRAIARSMAQSERFESAVLALSANSQAAVIAQMQVQQQGRQDQAGAALTENDLVEAARARERRQPRPAT